MSTAQHHATAENKAIIEISADTNSEIKHDTNNYTSNRGIRTASSSTNNIEFEPWCSRTNDVIRDIASEFKVLVVVSSKLPPDISALCSVLDIHGFMYLSWIHQLENTASYDVVIFSISNISPSFAHAFHQNSYKKVLFFLQNDKNKEYILFQPSKISEIRLECDSRVDTELSESFLDDTTTDSSSIFANLNASSEINGLKLRHGKNTVFLSKRSIKRLSAMPDKDAFSCVLQDNTFLPGFKKYIYSNWEMRSIHSLLEKYMQLDDNAYDIVNESESDDALLGKYVFSELSVPCTNANLFPVNNAHSILINLLNTIKTAFEAKYLFIRTIPMDFCHKSTYSSLTVDFFEKTVYYSDDESSQPNNTVLKANNKVLKSNNKVLKSNNKVLQSKFNFNDNLTKKDKVNRCALLFIDYLRASNILFDNYGLNKEQLYAMPVVNRLLEFCYGTADPISLENIRNEYFATRGNIRRGARHQLVERNGLVELMDSTDAMKMLQTLFKRDKMIDLQHFKNANSDQKAVLDETPASKSLLEGVVNTESLEFVYRKIPNNLNYDNLSYDNRNSEKQLRNNSVNCENIKMGINKDNEKCISSELMLYAFKGAETGILCRPSFTETYVTEDGTTVVSLNRICPTPQQLVLIKFYQLLFFKSLSFSIFQSTKQTYRYHYYAVPLKTTSATNSSISNGYKTNKEIDWAYLDSCYSNFLVAQLHNSDLYSENLLWNPFINSFCIYASEYLHGIEESLDSSKTYLSYFEEMYSVALKNRTGEMLFKGVSLEVLSSRYKKASSVAVHGTNNAVENSSAIKHIEEIRSGNAIVNNIKDTDIYIIEAKEVCFITPIKISIIKEASEFIGRFSLFEDVCIAHELREFLRLDGVSLPLINMALTHSRENRKNNYERLEFLGDVVLKYIITNYLYINEIINMNNSMNMNNNDSINNSSINVNNNDINNNNTNENSMCIVSRKDSIICNENLFKVCMNKQIYKYFKSTPYYYKMFQAPVIEGLDEFKAYFNISPVFNSDNLNVYLETIKNSREGSKKIYADIIEALIGVVYLSKGLEGSIDFIVNLGIIEEECGFHGSLTGTNGENNVNINVNINSNSNINSNKNVFIRITKNSIYSAPVYAGTLLSENIVNIENILGYSFANKGLLERAVIHPSYDNLFGSDPFQNLELVGDSALDLFVVEKIYGDGQNECPEDMHRGKGGYVNNQSIRNIIFNTGLRSEIKTYFDKPEESMAVDENINDKMKKSKIYSDIFEAIVGAILVDLNWDFGSFREAMDRKIWGYLESNKIKIDERIAS
ncbi:endoribonuclease Dicer [Enteropsectra breve]|nr:endoribonuclease Dicer [Enteropsectra breve]